ncbi:MAG: hypothetical protein PVF17_00975 [Ignavibacteria bacterium]|jgi:uncharacterized protein (DUF736 family)
MSKKIGAAWIKKTQDGREWISISIDTLHGQINLAMFRNDKKEKDSHPDYNIVQSRGKKNKGENIEDDIPF